MQFKLVVLINLNEQQWTHSSFSIIRHSLPNNGRILPALTEKSKIKKLPLLGFELTSSRLSVSHSANYASKESVGKEISEMSFVSCTTSHVGLCSFLESVEHRQPNSKLAQLAECETDDLEVVG